MFDLAFKGAVAELRSCLQKKPSAVNTLSTDRGVSLLYTAARWGHLDSCRMLIEEFNADINLQNRENKSTPLHGAAFGGHHTVVSYLLLHGANPNARNAYGEFPVDNAKSPAEGVNITQMRLTVTAVVTPVAAVVAPVSAAVAPAVAPTPVAAVPVAIDPVPIPVPSSPSKVAGGDYNSMSVAQLRALCSSRGLATTGTKATLISRLQGGTEAPEKKERPEDAVVTDAPAAKKHCPEAIVAPATDAAPTPVTSTAPVTVPVPLEAAVASTCVKGMCEPSDKAWIEKMRNAIVTQTEVPPNTQEFWDLEEKVSAWNQGRNEDYVSNRLKKKKKPLTFILKRAWKVQNDVLEEAFQQVRKTFIADLGEQHSRVRVAFHGTREANIPSILKTGLLRFKHPLNPCTTQADDGYFGTNLKGVYVSRYYDYTLKYCNGLNPLDEGDVVKTLMFKCLPGKVANIAKLNMGMEPTPGFNSHSSPNNLEWYLFDERQLCPEYVIEMKAQIDTRTAADDE